MGKERQDLNRKSSASSRESHGSPWACAELQGKKGLDQGWGGVTEDIFCGAPAEGLLTIWLKEATLPIMRSRPTSACGSWWAEAWAPGPRETEGQSQGGLLLQPPIPFRSLLQPSCPPSDPSQSHQTPCLLSYLACA